MEGVIHEESKQRSGKSDIKALVAAIGSVQVRNIVNREQQDKLVEAAQDSTRLARIRYQGGSTGYLEVLTADSNLYTAQLNLVSAQQGKALTLVQLYGALGGGWQP